MTILARIAAVYRQFMTNLFIRFYKHIISR